MKLYWTDVSSGRNKEKGKEAFRWETTNKQIRKTKFTALKDQQCSLNMQIRLAMQLHDKKAQEDLEKKLREVTEKIEQIIF